MTYSPWTALIRSFYSAPFYRHVAKRWRPVAIAYLFFVLALCWTPTFLKMNWRITRGLQRVQAEVIPQIPVLRFENGQFTTPEAKPYILSFGSAKAPIDVIIDTTGRIKSLDGRPAFMLVTKNRLFIRQRTGEIRTYDLSKSRARPFVLSPDRIRRILGPLKYWALGALYLFIFIASFLKRLIQAFLIALCGLVLASFMKLELDLGALLSLAIVAMTPAMALETVIGLTGKYTPWLWVLWFGLISGYFLFALNAASDQAPE
jgi:Protein of unknown function (DUF1189)